MWADIYFKGFVGVVIGLLSYLLGAFDAMLMALLTMMAIDFLTGIIKAFVIREISSRKMFHGGAKKIGILLIVAVANVIDGILDKSGVLRTITICYFIANEGVSMLENWSLMGLPVPEKLRNVLAQLKKDE